MSNIPDAINLYLKKYGFRAFKPKAVLFDMDGVLYDSMPNHAIACHESMKMFGINMTASDAYLTEGARGIDTIRHMVEKQQGRIISEIEAQKMYDEKSRVFHSMNEAPLMPGIKDLMTQITECGIDIGVVTGSGQRPLIKRLLHDFSDFLDENHITTAYDVSKGKPAPDPYLKGLSKFCGLNPWEAVVIENAPLGVEAGVAAKIFTIAVNTGPLPDACLKEKGADLLFSSITDLADSGFFLAHDLL
jgi:HAD superfamily hydrolase (TIGR01509 family)